MKTKALVLSLLVAGLLLRPSEGLGQQAKQATITSAQWTWVSGSNTINHAGVYGTKGVAASTNMPGSRQQAASWVDPLGNFWVFGGYGEDIFASSGWLNDLWKFDGTNWTWMGGTSNVNNWGVYGTRGIADPNNTPGGRAQATSWVDAQGIVWLFGGNGQGEQYYRGYLNDLWKFDGTNWTWVSGTGAIAQQGMYATKGTPAPQNLPGSRYGASGWVDATGRLWLFGGVGYDLGGSQGNLNDLWMFDGANWTWVNGSNTSFQNGHYGTQGVPDPANSPSGRQDASAWVDDTGHFWLFGGYGYDAAFSQGALGDLWKFDGSIWTWVAGAAVVNQPGAYGTKGTGAGGNLPGSRYGASAWM